MVSHFLRRRVGVPWFVGSWRGTGLERKEHWKKNSDGRNLVPTLILKKGSKLPTNCQ